MVHVIVSSLASDVTGSLLSVGVDLNYSLTRGGCGAYYDDDLAYGATRQVLYRRDVGSHVKGEITSLIEVALDCEFEYGWGFLRSLLLLWWGGNCVRGGRPMRSKLFGFYGRSSCYSVTHSN